MAKKTKSEKSEKPKQSVKRLKKIFYEIDKYEREKGIQDAVNMSLHHNPPRIWFTFAGDKFVKPLQNLRIGNYSSKKFQKVASSYGLIMDGISRRKYLPNNKVMIPYKENLEERADGEDKPKNKGVA